MLQGKGCRDRGVGDELVRRGKGREVTFKGVTYQETYEKKEGRRKKKEGRRKKKEGRRKKKEEIRKKK